MTDDREIIVRTEGRAGCFTLNRPAALNAVTLHQIRTIRRMLDQWRDDLAVQRIIIDAAGDKAFAAGGDVRALYDSRPGGAAENPDYHRNFWREEYELNALIAAYPKPYIAVMDGITMGGGVGISAHGSHRIVTERAKIAMPETGIGLMPDVGGSYLLARAPGELGIFMGLTGAMMPHRDTIVAGFADTFVHGDRQVHMICDLCALDDTSATGVDKVIAMHAGGDGAAPVLERMADISRCFAFERLEDIYGALGRLDTDWARQTLQRLTGRSPLAMKVTLAAVRAQRKHLDLRQALTVEYRLTNRLFECGEFIEGIRALIIDKDKAPKWSPASIAEVTDGHVARMMAPFPEGEEFVLG